MARRVWINAGSIGLGLLVFTVSQARGTSTAHLVAQSHKAEGFETSRTFELGVGRATRTFTFRERSGVILVNRLTVVGGVRVVVAARIPHLAGAEVAIWPLPGGPSLRCHRRGVFEICNQEAEWCPMPPAVWHFHLVKLSGPAGPVRFDYVVAPAPR